MASFTSDSDWGADVESSGRYPDDGSDWCGGDGSSNYRVANRFDITALPAADTVTQVDVSIQVDSVTGAGSSTWILGPYHGDGQSDPEANTVSQMYARCDVSSDNYLTGITSYRTTGSKTHTDLGSTANADVEAARDAGTRFSLAWRITATNNANNRCEFAEYTDGTTPPTLTITHETASSGGIVILRRRMESN